MRPPSLPSESSLRLCTGKGSYSTHVLFCTFVHWAWLQMKLLLAGVALASALVCSRALPGAPSVPIGSIAGLQSQSGQYNIRHCDFQLFAFDGYDPAPTQDFNWTIAAAVNGVNGSVSFQSTNYPTMCVRPRLSASSCLTAIRLGYGCACVQAGWFGAPVTLSFVFMCIGTTLYVCYGV